MATRTTRPRNWSKYNRALQQRGAITFWIDKKSLSSWYTKKANGKKGRPTIYTDIAVQTMLIVKYVYRLSLRSVQGFLNSLNLPVKPMSYTQLSRRQKTITLPKLPKGNGVLHIAIDGTGLKVYGEGEWKVRAHGYAKRRDWMKLHIGINVDTQEIVCEKLTDNHCAEYKQLNDLLKGFDQLGDVMTDAGYDYHKSYELIKEHGGSPLISPNCNPKHRAKKLKHLRPDKPRDLYRWIQQVIGLKNWKKLNRYHRRSLVETAFYRLKQLLGDKLMSRTYDAQKTEIGLKCRILNKITVHKA